MSLPGFNWKRTLGQKMRYISRERAIEILEDHRTKYGNNIGDPNIKELTGGFSSQNIDFFVLRKLSEKAGYISPMR